VIAMERSGVVRHYSNRSHCPSQHFIDSMPKP